MSEAKIMAMSKAKKTLSLVLLGVLLILAIGLYNLRAMGRAEYWKSRSVSSRKPTELPHRNSV